MKAGTDPDELSDAPATDPSLMRLAAGLRVGLAGLVLLVGTLVPDPRVVQPAYSIVGLTYLAAAVGWRLLAPGRVRGRCRIIGPAADLAFLLTLSALSGGSSSLIQPVFFLLPVVVAFLGVPWATGTLGAAVALGYLVVASAFSGSQAPGPVIWLHFGFLVWLAAGTTAMSAAIGRRERRLRELRRQQRDLVAESLRIEERERARLAEQLHDGPLQVLMAGRLTLGLVADGLTGRAGSEPDRTQPDRTEPDLTRAAPAFDGTGAAAEVRAVRDDLAEAARDIRATVRGLHPQVLDELGLDAAIRQLVDAFRARTAVRLDLRIDPAGGEPDRDRDALAYGAVRELLVNAAKHARAGTIRIALDRDAADGSLELLVEDDGVGFDPAVLPGRVAQGHIGLSALRARVTAAGGSVDIRSGADGTAVTVRLPGVAGPRRT